MEPLADRRDGVAQEAVEAGAGLGGPAGEQLGEPVAEPVTVDESPVHQAQLDAGDEDDLGAGRA
ncbi:hypothetical protein BC793_14819 [Actinoplanes xinjiangensis]|uniref:Uncharacterized protein n=1 Tax=Actinoplanes xinjiangensis TaxID=512350 RepID=A0A316EGX4_9ACTN|nr:hypothetical protein BC793_14819 [Actinoplanes xinjiangensis]GIF45127.1 hypothetical protein Axi01nite_94380 [Actinoplanes xinjiangensis]